MHMSSFQGEVCAPGSMGGSWANVFTCIYRGWASLMGYIPQEKVSVHRNKWLPSSVCLKEMYSSKQNLFNCVTKWGQTEWGLCAQPSAGAASGRLQRVHEQTAGLETMLWYLNLCAGSQVSFLVSAILQTQLRTSFNGFFQAVVCKPARIHHKKVTRKPDRSHPFPHHAAPSSFHVYMRKQTNWRSNKNNEHSVLEPGLLGCLVVHRNQQIRIDKMGLEFSFKKKMREVLIS